MSNTVALVPTPTDLNLHSPELGPWFDSDIELPIPSAGRLDVTVTVPDDQDVHWLPPAIGFLSFFIATDVRPAGLAALRGPDGAPAFDTDSLVAVFRLLPWVERRLDSLTTAGVSSLANRNTGGSGTRPIVRYLTMELDLPSSVGDLEAYLPADFDFPLTFTALELSDEDKAAHLGLTWDGTTLGNGPTPMTDLLQPGDLPVLNLSQKMLKLPQGSTAKLGAFDHRGRPIDPGAVAAWWTILATSTFNNLWSDSVPTRTASVEEGVTFHVTNAHEGALSTTARNRLDIAPSLGTNDVGTSTVGTSTVATGVSVSFTDAPSGIGAADDFPQPLVAVLPDGEYGSQLSLWAQSNDRPERDFARIAVLSVEHELVGQRRDTSATEGIAKRRAEDQNRASTGVRPGRSQRGALLSGIDDVLEALSDPADAAGQFQLVSSVLHRDTGPISYDLAPVEPPSEPPAVTAVALVGGGGGGTAGPAPQTLSVALDQQVLMTAQFPSSLAGAWVRFRPLGFDHDSASHIRMNGGAAPIDGDGLATAVVPLPDGSVEPDPPANSTEDAVPPPRLGVDVSVATAIGAVTFTDLRFDRPYPLDPTPVPLDQATGELLVCSTGQRHDANDGIPNGEVPSGSPVVAMADPPELIDRTSVPDVLFDSSVATNLLDPFDAAENATNDVVQLTAPAFTSQVDHPTAGGDIFDPATDGRYRFQERGILQLGNPWSAGVPLPGMERLEVVAANAEADSAVIGATPLLSHFHQLGDARQGHPGCPASQEVQGNGALIRGSGSVAFAEYALDRTTDNSVDLVLNALDNPIDDPDTTDPGLWVAGLRTEAAGVAGGAIDLGLNELIDDTPFGGTLDDLFAFVGGVASDLPGSTANEIAFALRMLERRLLTGAFGAREGATAMTAAVEQAEDFIYIETPAFDDLTFGTQHDEVSFWQTLIDRMDAVPTLRVAVCIPSDLLPGAPDSLKDIRSIGVSDALGALNSGDRVDRFIAFSPAAGAGRSLGLGSTTVVVDDLVAFVGSTHLWRRGLSFDSSFMAAVFDEQMARGRSTEVALFRIATIAARLGLTTAQVPLDPPDIITAITDLAARGGLDRLDSASVKPQVLDAVIDDAVWNPDGSFANSADLEAWRDVLLNNSEINGVI